MSGPMRMQDALAKVEASRREDLEPTSILWVGVGWLISFQSRRYMETRSFLDQVVGGPTLVLESGEVVEFNGARSGLDSVISWATQNAQLDRLAPWVVEQHAMNPPGQPAPELQWDFAHRYLGADFEWCAVDRHGSVAVFNTLGRGPLPLFHPFRTSPEAAARLRGALDGLVKICASRPPGRERATRGLLVFDWDPRRQNYVVVAVPFGRARLGVGQLPELARSYEFPLELPRSVGEVLDPAPR